MNDFVDYSFLHSSLQTPVIYLLSPVALHCQSPAMSNLFKPKAFTSKALEPEPFTPVNQLRKNPRLINAYDRLFNKAPLVQSGRTAYQEIYHDGLATLRYYPAAATAPIKHRIPLVFVAPLAINMDIYDLFHDRSLVSYFTAQGFEVYLMDWGNPSRKHAKLNFGHYVLELMPNMLAQVRQHSGQQQVTLHGWSMAGVFTLLYAAATKDPNIKNIIILGTPIDAYASGGIGRLYRHAGNSFRWLQNKTGLHPRQLPATLLHSPGWSNALGFKLLDPVGTLKGHINLIRQLDDRKAVEAHATLGSFLNNMVDYPGGINRDMLLKVWMENSLSRGEFPIGGQTAYLKDIHASLLAGGGCNDGMVTVDSVRPLTRLVGTDDATFTTIPGGHVGLMSSQQAATEFWPFMANWLATRSS